MEFWRGPILPVLWRREPVQGLAGSRPLRNLSRRLVATGFLPSPQLSFRGVVDSRVRGNHHGLVRPHKRDENGLAPGTGNHKGCPYNRLAGGYFQRNRSCRLPPAPPGMKMALISSCLVGLTARHRRWIPAFAGMTVWGCGNDDLKVVSVIFVPRRLPLRRQVTVCPGRRLDSGLRRNDGGCWRAGYYQRNRSCRLSPTPPGMKMALISSCLVGLTARHRRWIPAFAGMTIAASFGQFSG